MPNWTNATPTNWRQTLALLIIAVVIWSINLSVRHERHAQRTVSAVKFGMSRHQVRELAGEPDKTQEMRSDYGSSDYWYYGSTQVCFDGDRVVSINRY